MALATYSDLQASLAGWLAKSNLTAVIPDFIRLAEVQMSRRLRIRIMEEDLSLTTVAGTQTVSVAALDPALKQIRYIYVDGNPQNPLTYRTPEQLIEEYSGATQGIPEVFSLKGNNLMLGPTPDAAYNLLGIYWGAIPALSVSNPTNDMLTENPDAYLYGSLLQAAPYLKNDARISVWGNLFMQIMTDIQNEDDADRHPTASLQVRTDTYNP